MTNNFENKNLHGANDEVEDFFHFGKGKGDVRFFFQFFFQFEKKKITFITHKKISKGVMNVFFFLGPL
jgi:hypothetical protein